MSDLEPFESPKILIHGAKENIADFKASCERFLETNTYDTVNYIDPKTREQVVKLKFHHRIPPKIRLAAYHIVNDLRHSLDQAACDAAVLLGRKDPRDVYFPFAKSEKEFENEAASRLKNVHSGLVAFIKSFKPHSEGDNLLYSVGSLAGPNKHQRILGMSLSNSGVTIGANGIPWALHPRGGSLSIGINKWNELRNELEFARAGHQVIGNIDARPAIQIVLGTGEAPLSAPAASVLDEFATKVESIVLAIEAETARLKAAH